MLSQRTSSVIFLRSLFQKCHEVEILNNQKSEVNVQSNNFNGELYSAHDTSTKSDGGG